MRRRRGFSDDGKFSFESLLIDGVDEYINANALETALQATTTGTISYWVKPVSGTPAGFETHVMFNQNASNVALAIDVDTSGILRAYVIFVGSFKWLLVTDAAPFSDNTWYHVAVVQDGTSPVIYVNGVAVAQTFANETDKTAWHNGLSNNEGNIGRANNNGADFRYFNGNLDDILFTSDAKSAADILDIYNNGKPKDESGISNGVSYYKFDGDIVNTCTDSIGSNNLTYVNIEQSDIEEDAPE